MATLPKIVMLVFIDVGEENIGVSFCILALRGNGMFAILDGVETIACRAQQNVASMVFYHGIYTRLPSFR